MTPEELNDWLRDSEARAIKMEKLAAESEARAQAIRQRIESDTTALDELERSLQELQGRVSYLEGFTRTIAPNHWWELAKMVLLAVALVLAVVK